MILNVLLGLGALGWAMNCALFQARRRGGYALMNGVLATVAMALLIARLS